MTLLTFYPSSLRLPVALISIPAGRQTCQPPLLVSIQTEAHTLRWGCGVHGTPMYRSEGQQRVGKGSALDLCLEVMGTHGSADALQGRMWAGIPPPRQVLSQPQPASLLLCCLQQGGDGSLAPCGWRLNGNQHLGWDFFSWWLRGKWPAPSPACLWKAHLSEGYWFVGGRQRARGAQRRLGICYCLNAAKILIKCSWYSIVIFPLVIHTKFIIKR